MKKTSKEITNSQVKPELQAYACEFQLKEYTQC